MKQRTIAYFAALAIMVPACSSDDDGSARASDPPDALPATTALRAPATTAPTAVTAAAADTTSAAVPTAGTAAPAPQEPIEAPIEQAQPPAANPVTDTASDPLSTFAMDVDTGSYTYARQALQNGVVPDPATVRTEEFVNAFDQGYEPPTDSAFAVTVDATSAPFLEPSSRVVRVGIQGRVIDDADRKDANLTFVVDISGSMQDPGKLDAVRPALLSLVESLRLTDRVGIVVYSDDTRIALASTPVSEHSAIEAAIMSLTTEGSTNVEDGLRLGYEQARQVRDPERVNRVILLSDGVANVGVTGPDEMLEVIGDAARDGIDLVTVGFGLGDYNDTLMEQLADRGDGFYAYVDGEREAVRLFSEDLTGTLQTIAREAKVQVEFNPATVSNYRLIGFENRAVADEDFRDDSVDGGEVGAGHSVTALYEVTLQESAATDDWLARAAIRWLDPDTLEPSEASTTLLGGDTSNSIGEAPMRLQQDVYVAAFAESLRGSGWNELISLSGLSENLHSLGSRLDDSDLLEVAALVDSRIQLG